MLNFGENLIKALHDKYIGGKIEEDSTDKPDSRWEFIEMDKIHKIQRYTYIFFVKKNFLINLILVLD